MGCSPEEIAKLVSSSRARLFSELDADRKNIFLSGEGMINLNADELTGMRDTLLGYADKLRVIAFAREPVSHRSSAFAEYLKHGRGDFEVPRHSFRKALGKFVDVFGRDAMDVYAYNPGDDAVGRMAEILAVTPPERGELRAKRPVAGFHPG